MSVRSRRFLVRPLLLLGTCHILHPVVMMPTVVIFLRGGVMVHPRCPASFSPHHQRLAGVRLRTTPFNFNASNQAPLRRCCLSHLPLAFFLLVN